MRNVRVLLVGAGDARDQATYARLRREHERVWFALLGENALLAGAPGVVRVQDLEHAARVADSIEAELVLVQCPELLFQDAVHMLAGPHRRVIGPGSHAAELEANKVRCKEFMDAHAVATPCWGAYDSADDARRFLREHWCDGRRFVVKSELYLSDANTRTAVPRDLAGALAAVSRLESLPESERGTRILVEERVSGPELSLHLLLDGRNAVQAPPVCDYKSLLDGDRGPNTHGMGAVAAGRMRPEHAACLSERVLGPTLAGLAAEERYYAGVLYVGVIWSPSGPLALEYNVRPGNPEWIALLPMLKDRLADVLELMASGRLEEAPPRWDRSIVSGCLFVTVPGYPFISESIAAPVRGLDSLSADVQMLGEGVRGESEVQAGVGRSLALAAQGRTKAEMREKLYGAVRRLSFPGMHYRTDIGESRGLITEGTTEEVG